MDGLAEFCTETLERHGCASASVAVVRGGEVVLAEAYGLADRESGRAAAPETVYRLASLTKPITATAVCAAADEGLFDLDAPLPGGFDPAPTIRQTLRHHGGFGGHYAWQYGEDTHRVPTEWYADHLYRTPGSGFEYSNLGYHHLGSLLGRTEGELDEAIRARVAEPLGLASLRVGAEYPGEGPTAERYTADGRRYPVCRSGHPAAGDAWATATDIALFARNCAGLLRPETAAAVYEAVPISPAQGYGLGWSVSTGPGPLMYSHSGGMGGVGTMAVRLPEPDLALAVLTNSTDKKARDAILHHLLERLAPGFDPAGLSSLPDTSRPMTLPEGEWSGGIRTREGELPLRVAVLADGRVEVRLDGVGTETAAANASAEWQLRTVVPLQLPTADARRDSPLLALELALREGRLAGAARAVTSGESGTGRLGNYLAHPCELLPS